ncbi:hypothetical protein HYDPIDRAFT_115628 [Hydnomerulius pinastri MD-312]|uniref:Uncharacterized protein n=1 Tax=Hydnomerulius pinastri MD-312 TaxID=994086 RepID=A0A0C9VUQ7_9AGAM|nr:hypothetical protein HYDPIDRAFT_115628 [Hydnomerulius pinastri MD-312]
MSWVCESQVASGRYVGSTIHGQPPTNINLNSHKSGDIYTRMTPFPQTPHPS